MYKSSKICKDSIKFLEVDSNPLGCMNKKFYLKKQKKQLQISVYYLHSDK